MTLAVMILFDRLVGVLHALSESCTVWRRVFLFIQSVSLPDPFGICDDTLELRYYESSYSVSKCRLECQADSLNATCGCKDAHMPGMHERCQQQLTSHTFVTFDRLAFGFIAFL